ncbi:MAG: zf-HC2 domain-containing protein [Candidatus Hinthialibacter antarcticus]|nr:zf-HC2 domain-containing protein [Candidatus Hinthialibacter antarcticus]
MRFTCDEIQSRWPEHLYRELSEPEQTAFVQHLNQCESCRAEEAQWRGLLGRFDGWAAEVSDAPQELVPRVKRQVRLYEDWSRQNWQSVRNWAVGAAAVCALALGGAWGLVSQIDRSASEWDSRGAFFEKMYSKEAVDVFREQGVLHEFKPEIAAESKEPDPPQTHLESAS